MKAVFRWAMIAAAAAGLALAQEAANGWTAVGDDARQAQYRKLPGKEEVFTGTLEALPAPRGASTLMRDHGYKLAGRLIAGRKLAALDGLAGQAVELRGKRVDMELEGQSLREIAPGFIRPAPKQP